MNNRGRGIDQYPGGVIVHHGCPKKLMEAAGSEASITIVVDVSFDNEASKLKALKQLFSWFTNDVPADSNSNSNRLLREVAAATTAVATRASSFLLRNIDPNRIVKDVIDAKASLLLTSCETYNCNETAIKGK